MSKEFWERFREVRDGGRSPQESMARRLERTDRPHLYNVLGSKYTAEQWQVKHVCAAFLSAVLAGQFESVRLPFRTNMPHAAKPALENLRRAFEEEGFTPARFDVTPLSEKEGDLIISLFSQEELRRSPKKQARTASG